MKPVFIIAIVVVIVVVSFFIFQEVTRQAILEQTRIGFEECNTNMENLLNINQVEEYAECIEKLSDKLEEFNENRFP